MKISVIVPVYKVEPYLRKCVDSVLNQTFNDFELILVDDGSPDNSGKICDEIAQADSRIKVIHQKNGGLSAARNTGIEWVLKKSAAEYITFIDSDDWVEAEYLMELFRGITLGVDISCVGYVNVFEDGVCHNCCLGGTWQLESPERYWVGNGYVSATLAWGKLYRKELFANVRYPEGRINEDLFTTYRILFQVKKIAVREIPLYNYFHRNESIMHSSWSMRRLDAVDALKNSMDYFKRRGFNIAYEFSRRRLLVVMAEAIPHLERCEDGRAIEFREHIQRESKVLRLPFWENREFYRLMNIRFYKLRWICGMLGDALRNHRRSWLAQDSVRIGKMLMKRCLARRKKAI